MSADIEVSIGMGEATRLWRRHPDTLKKMARRGEIPYEITPSGRWRFKVRAYLEKLAAQAHPQNS